MVRSCTLVLMAALTLLSAPEVDAGRRRDGRRCRRDAQCLSGTCCNGRCSPESASCNEVSGIGQADAAPRPAGQGKPAPPSEKCRNGSFCGTCGICRKGRCTGDDGRCGSCKVCSQDGSACLAVPDGSGSGPAGYYNCGPDAHGGLTCCSGTCVDVHGDINNCDACGNACTDGKSCNAIGTGGWECKCRDYETECNGSCANVQDDPNNCGQCGRVCTSGTCSNGHCECVTHCDGSGNCTGGDAACGPCEICESGACVGCAGGQICCGGGCVGTQTDPNNCGACGTTCGAGKMCCEGGCVDTSTDPNNCGWCGNVCAANEECTGGVCAPTCPTDFALCPTDYGHTCCPPFSPYLPGCCRPQEDWVWGYCCGPFTS